MRIVTALVILLYTGIGIAQTRNWKTQTSKDGKVVVQNEIVKINKGKHIYYIAKTEGKFNLKQAEKYLRNSENHKNFLENTTESTELKTLSDTEWITYYYFDAPWPMPNSDAVESFTLSKTNTTLTIKAISSPKALEIKDVKRMDTYNITYHFELIDEQTTQLTITADFIPVSSVPKWLMNGWFPKGPAGIANRLIHEISQESIK